MSGRTYDMTITNVELLRLGRRTKTSRKLLSWKQKDFCERCGLERSYFDGVERGKCNLTFSNLCQICNGLNCDVAADPHWTHHGRPSRFRTWDAQPGTDHRHRA
jgi:transcriptional regulator with XRE-family HTH domain